MNELIQFIIGLYCLIKIFQWLDTIPKYPDPIDTPQDYM